MSGKSILLAKLSVMMNKVLLLIRDKLTTNLQKENIKKDVVSGYLGLIDSTSDDLWDSIFLNPVKVKGEGALKNGKRACISGLDRTAQYINRPVCFNLNVVIITNFPGGRHPGNANYPIEKNQS